ncbi:MAG: hypothetical protein DWI10_08025 [Planctomycetota bacterium]|nr:MAG: hypothetical protein DWI10_08025 [Planctomycetota bacterium]
MCACTTELKDQPMMTVRDELILRWTPVDAPAATRMRWKAFARVNIELELMLGVCPAGNAWGLAHAKAQFAPGLSTSEILLEMEEDELRSIHVARSFEDPGVAIGGGITVGTGLGIDWNIPAGGRRATLKDTQFLNFNAASCISPPSDQVVHDYVFFIDLEADTHAKLYSGRKSYTVADAEVLDFSVFIEDGCAECSDPQPALPPSSTGGG